MVTATKRDKAHLLEGEDTANEPGRTPGQAEGEDVGDAPYDPAADPGRTPGQAEGGEDILEGRDLEEKAPSTPPAKLQPGQLAQQTPKRNQAQAAKTSQLRTKVNKWEPRVNVEEVLRWSALIGGGWLALYGLRHSLGSLTVIGIAGGLLYYALKGRWPLATQNAWPATTPTRM